jgi:hypothetical protein
MDGRATNVNVNKSFCQDRPQALFNVNGQLNNFALNNLNQGVLN